MIPIAFYAPLKSPDHPVASGDRTMARLFRDALEAAGFAPALASTLRSLDLAGDPDRQAALAAEGAREADRIVVEALAAPPPRRPRLWFTYHSYYKAPDLVGPAVARRLGIPYVVAEASRAMKRATGPWAAGHAAAEAALAAATAVICLTEHDRDALARDPALAGRLLRLPPFTRIPPARHTARAAGESPRLLAVGMMREGDKLASYRLLAAALARMAERPWTLAIAGDGPARPTVEAAFAPFGRRVTLQGALPPDALGPLYAASDLLVWPAVNEAFGMALLEAQAAGCPVVAGDFGGVADACRPGLTALLCPPRDAAAFAEAVASLLADPARLARMGAEAASFVAAERSMEQAAATLGAALRPLLGAGEAAA